ncbi:GumC family protein [Hoeflea sp. TYP-13]|uniref:GumC family protein n=1 Tax=Hoeflea sp. TYP-13 TaxID=3230023 RepID=UPI0034C5B706
MLNNAPGPQGSHLPGRMDGRYGSTELAAYAPWHPGLGYGREMEEEESGISPLALFLYLLKYRWLIAILLAVGLVAGIIMTWMQTPKYRSTAQLEVMAPSAKVFQDLEVISESSDFRMFLTAREKLRSRSIAQRVVFELDLADDANFLIPAPHFAPSNLFARAFGYDLSGDIGEFSAEEREQMAINRVRNNLSVELIKNTSLLAITFEDQNPQLASSIANQVAASFINQRIDQTSETSDLARQFVQEQVIQVKRKLQTSEQALVDYAKKVGITVTGSENSLIASNIEEINNALSKAIQERLDYGRLVGQIEIGRGASIPQVLESDGIQHLKQMVAELSAEYQQKLSTFKPDFPDMKQLQAQIRELKKQIDEATLVVTSSIRQKYDEVIAKEEDLRAKLSELEAEQATFQDKNIQYTILKREVDSNRLQYENLIGKLNEVGVGSELKRQNIAIVDAAVTPRSPFSPRLTVNVAAALLLCMVLAAAIIYILELLNNTFSNPDQIEDDLNLPVLGILPKVEEAKISEQLSDQASAMSEAYRSLRTSLQFTGTGGSPQTLLVTSSEPSEGKSTTSFKLAQDFGSLGMRVLLIDADLRKPALHRLFATDNTIGLSNLLTNTLNRDDTKRIFRQTRFTNVTLLTAGTIPPNPADLLSSPKMAMILQACADRYDIVIIDSPPVMGLSDAPILSRLVEGVLLIVAANQVTRKSAAAAVKRIKTVGGHMFGATLSKFAASSFEYAYSYRYMNDRYYTLSDENDSSSDKSGARRGEFADDPLEKARGRMRRAGDFFRRRLSGA